MTATRDSPLKRCPLSAGLVQEPTRQVPTAGAAAEAEGVGEQSEQLLKRERCRWFGLVERLRYLLVELLSFLKQRRRQEEAVQ